MEIKPMGSKNQGGWEGRDKSNDVLTLLNLPFPTFGLYPSTWGNLLTVGQFISSQEMAVHDF